MKNNDNSNGEEIKQDNFENSGEDDEESNFDDSDNDPLKGHNYEIKFEYNAESKRSRRIMVCKYNNCNKEFIKTWNIVDHFRFHTNKDSFTCPICKRNDFKEEGEFYEHKLKHKVSTSLSSLQKYCCSKC